MTEKIGKNNTHLVYSLVFLILIAIVISTNIFSFNDIEATIFDKVKENQLIETKFAAKNLENHIIQVKDELTTLTKFPISDLNGCNGKLREIQEKTEAKSQVILRVDANGNVVECSSPDFTDFLNLNLEKKEYFSIPKETNEPYISGIITQSGNKQIFVSVPIFETNEYTPYPNFKEDFKGVLISVVDIELLHNLYFPKFFETSNNRFILVNSETEETILKSEIVPEFNSISGALSNKNLEVIDFLHFGETIKTSTDLILGTEKWTLYVFSPLEFHSKDIDKLKRRQMYSLVLILAGIITIFILFIKIHKSKEEVQQKLHNLGIKVSLEKNKFTTSDLNIEKNKIYLIKEEDENNCFDVFISALNKGYAGFGITRDDPKKVKEKYNLSETSFLWLTENNVDIPHETNVTKILELIKEFIKESEKSVILIEKLDYLFLQNTFDDMKKAIHSLKDLSLENDCIIILSINNKLAKDEELSLVKSEVIDIYGKHLSDNVDLSDLEHNILNFINNGNIQNKTISFKDINNEFNITKPTTRTKIKNMQRLGLITIEVKGRVKSLKITSLGRRLIK